MQSANPILPLDELIPDVEARVFSNRNGEKRVYLYGSRDVFGSETWCSHSYKVFSAPLTDLGAWTDHGVSFASRKGQGYVWAGEDADGVWWSDERLYAPDVNRIGDTYYMVICSAGGTCLGMAFSKDPEGPFSPARKILYDDGTETGSIDPSLYVEEIGDARKVYLLWGQRPAFHARGLLGAELIQDGEGLYTVVKKDTERVLFTGENDEFGFYEGASLRKIGGRYYILYPSDHGKGIHMMSYAVSDHPLGPYRFGGDILDNDGCDLEPGNNHGSFCRINGQWYLFYHRGFGNSNMQRRVCVEKIYFDGEGHIGDIHGNLVAMTNHGFGGPLNPYQRVEAAYATHVRLEGFRGGCYLTKGENGFHSLVHIQDGCCVEYRDFDFGKNNKSLCFTAEFLADSGGNMELLLDDPHSAPVGAVRIPPAPERSFRRYSARLSPISGVHTLYFRFQGEAGREIGELAAFWFHMEEQNFLDISV